MAAKPPGPGLGSLDAINAHAQKLITEITAKNESVPNAESAVASAAVPAFSAGTAAIDPDSGRLTAPTAPVAIDSTQTVPLADESDAEAGAAAEARAAGKTAAPVGADTRERAPDGKFTSADVNKPSGTAPSAPAAAPKTPDQKAAAAEAAADALLDQWQDLTFEHDDGSKYTVRAKAAEAKQVERFNQRQAIVNRKANYLDKYRASLEPLITSGQLDPVLPVLNRAVADPEFREFVAQAYNRRLAGLPLNAAPAQTPQAAAPPQAAPAAPVQMPEISDPYIAEALAPVLTPLMNELSQLRAQSQNWQQAQAAEQERQRQQQAVRQRQAEEIRLAHQEMAARYPGQFNPALADRDPAFNLVLRYAQDGGYGQYGHRSGLLLATNDYMRDRADAAGSPAAELFAQADAATMRAAQRQAASARAVTGGGTQAPAPVKPPPPQKPAPRDANGKLKPIREYQAETQAYVAATAGT